MLIPSGSSITSLTFYGARQPGGTHVAIQDASGSPVTLSVAAGNGYPLPDACFGYGAIKLVADAAGDVEISLKG